MRIWSLHPKYLDTKGLLALWRETLLAKNVLEGNTKGYKNHPQLLRFKESENPEGAVNYYLKYVWTEAKNRSYSFDKTKFTETGSIEKISVTSGQISFEAEHLLKKLEIRDKEKHELFKTLKQFEIHPLFNIVEGTIEVWEKI